MFELSLFVTAICAGIFLIVFSLLVYAAVTFRRRADDDGSEPPQVYGSNEVELAWTVIPVLIVVPLFLATARVIASIQKPAKPRDAVEVTGHFDVSCRTIIGDAQARRAGERVVVKGRGAGHAVVDERAFRHHTLPALQGLLCSALTLLSGGSVRLDLLSPGRQECVSPPC